MFLDYTFDWPRIIESLIVGIIGSLLVSVGFLWFILNKLRPKIIISPAICLSTESYIDEAGNGKQRNKYTFKIVNQSKYEAYDIIIELFVMQPINHIGANSNLKSKRLAIRTSNMTSINRFRSKNNKQDPFSMFAILIHTNEQLEPLLAAENSFVQLKITARHGLSGLAQTFEERFPNETCIKTNHKFKHGADTGTVPQNQTI
jgi:hypothetical protein